MNGANATPTPAAAPEPPKEGAPFTSGQVYMTPNGPMVQVRGRHPLMIHELAIDLPLDGLVQLVGSLALIAAQNGISVQMNRSSAVTAVARPQ